SLTAALREFAASALPAAITATTINATIIFLRTIGFSLPLVSPAGQSSRNVEDAAAWLTAFHFDERPGARLGHAQKSIILDEKGVLRLAAAGQARVPSNGLPGLDRLCEPAALALGGRQFELALPVAHGASLVVLLPRFRLAHPRVRTLASAQHLPVRRAPAACREHQRLHRTPP